MSCGMHWSVVRPHPANPSSLIPTAWAADNTCLKSSAIAPPFKVGMEMVRYTCGVLWKPGEVPHLFVSTLETVSGASVVCFY